MNSIEPSIAPGTRVLVTGGSGFTGQVLLRKLCERGIQVRAIVRGTSRREALSGLPIEWITGNVYDRDVVQKAVAGVSYIFHVAASYRQAGVDDTEYHRVHVESTMLLAEAALKEPDFKRFVHVSTVGVHGHIENPPADESAPFAPGDIYQRTKAEAEIWLHDFARKHNLPYTVIRPAAIYGPGDRRLLKLFKLAKAPVYVLLGRGQCLYHLIHVDDLTEAIIRAAWHPAALGEAIICGDPAAVSLEKMGRIIADELHRPFRLVRLPVWPFFLLADITEAVCKPFGISPPIYRRRVAFYTKDRSFDTGKLRNKLGFTYTWDTEAGLRATTRWYQEHGWL